MMERKTFVGVASAALTAVFSLGRADAASPVSEKVKRNPQTEYPKPPYPEQS